MWPIHYSRRGRQCQQGTYWDVQASGSYIGSHQDGLRVGAETLQGLQALPLLQPCMKSPDRQLQDLQESYQSAQRRHSIDKNKCPAWVACQEKVKSCVAAIVAAQYLGLCDLHVISHLTAAVAVHATID